MIIQKAEIEYVFIFHKFILSLREEHNVVD